MKDPPEPLHRQHGLLEIKCPYSARMLNPEVACTELNRLYCRIMITITKSKVLCMLQEGPGVTCLSGHLLVRTFVECLDYDPTFWKHV